MSMQESYAYLIAAVSGITIVTILCLTALRAWQGWLEYKKTALEQQPADNASPSTNTRIEMADLKERIRKLEAIAAGVDI